MNQSIKLPGGRELSKEQMSLLCANIREQTLIQMLYYENMSMEKASRIMGVPIEVAEKTHSDILSRISRFVDSLTSPSSTPTNLKSILMQLGNNLIQEKRFNPPEASQSDIRFLVNRARRSTDMVAIFTEWLNSTPEAVETLEKMGVQFPVAPRRANGLG